MGDLGQDDGSRPGLEPIAICGMSMRLPGGVRDAQSFWQALIEKKELICPVPDDRFNVDAFYSPHGKPGTIISPKAFYLTDAELGYLDTSVFSTSPHELRHIDPQQRMLLEITRECLENAGETDWRGKRVGCYVGTFGEDWLDLGAKDTLDAGMYRAAGASDFALSNRISYEYDSRGPSMTIKTGCSAAMMGLNEACWAINAGQCDSAIVAGANLIMTPTMTVSMGAAALSPTGTCKTFDAAADGYARGEAINAIYVKRLSNALADGNSIRAVIRGIGVNSDGQTSSTLTPSLVCQESLIRNTYAQAGLPLSKTAFFECHGTGTRVGDPIEAGAVDRVFGDFGIHIGAVKPNFGHSEGSSAITSIIKSVLTLENGMIPPNMRFSKPNPAINWRSGRLTVPVEETSWPHDRDERVSVNSFGIGGANGHVILDSARLWVKGVSSEATNVDETSSQLLVLSAAHEKSLVQLKSSYETVLSNGSTELYDLAHTLGNRRFHHPYRAFCVATSETENAKFSTTARVPGKSRVVFVFSGQGNAWPRMIKTFVRENPTFRETLIRLDTILAGLPECKFSLEHELICERTETLPQDAEIAQPLSVAIQICLCNALKAAGVQPDAVLGHSSGEIAAAYVVGALTEEEAIKVAFTADRLSNWIPAVVQCCRPSSVTLSGQTEQIEEAEEEIEEKYPNALIRRLRVNKAYHSRHMKSAGELCERMLTDQLRPVQPKIPFFSALMGRRLEQSENLGPQYWRRHMDGPVLFRTATEAIISEMKKDIVFAEIGPHPTLTSSLIQTCAEKKAQGVSHVSFMSSSGNTATRFLEGLGRLYQLGVRLDFHSLTPQGKTLTDLPNYAWHHDTKHWNETRIGREWRFREYPRHDLLGVRTGESSSIEPSWRNLLRLDDVGWIRPHQVQSDIVLPFTAYCAMAGEAVQQLHDQRGPFSLRRVRVGAPLTLGQKESTEIITTLRSMRLNDLIDSSWFEFCVSSFDGSQWIKHCSGAVRLGRDMTVGDEATPTVMDLARQVEKGDWYATLADVGLNYGAEFQRLESISADVSHLRAAANVKDERSLADSSYELHPATLDSAVQLIGVAASRGLSKNVEYLFVPIAVEDIYIAASEDLLSIRAEAEVSARGTISGEITAYSGSKTVLQIKGLTLYPVDGIASERSTDTHAAAELIWTPDLNLSSLSKALQYTKTVPKGGGCLLDGRNDSIETIGLLASANPLGSVLELATGTCNSTEEILKGLMTSFGERLYSTYTIAYASEESRTRWKEKFKDVEKINTAILDISEDMVSQRAPLQSYDLIIVDNDLLREPSDVWSSLDNLRRLMAPSASLVVHDRAILSRTTTKVDHNHEPDSVKAFLTPDTLTQAGFTDVEQLGDVLLVAKAESVAPNPTSIALLCAIKEDALAHEMITLFAHHGISAKVYSLSELSQSPEPQQIILSLLDHQDDPILLNPSPQNFSHLLTILQNQTYGILWITRSEPNYATILGLARTARNELQLPFYTLSLPEIKTPETKEAIIKVFSRCAQQQTKNPETEELLTFQQNCILVPRFQWKFLHNDLLSLPSDTTSQPIRL